MEDKLYLVSYLGGTHEDFFNKTLFATFSKIKAEKYCSKFNRILSKYKEYEKMPFKKEFGEHYLVFQNIEDIKMCYFEEIKFI